MDDWLQGGKGRLLPSVVSKIHQASHPIVNATNPVAGQIDDKHELEDL